MDNSVESLWTLAAKSRACARLLVFLQNTNITILDNWMEFRSRHSRSLSAGQPA